MENEIVKTAENESCAKVSEKLAKNAKKAWRDGWIITVLALSVYAFQVLSDYLMQAAIKALQLIKDDPSSFYRDSTDKLESFFASVNTVLMAVLFAALIINFIYRLSVSETPNERRGVLHGFLFGLGVSVGVAIAVGIKMFGIVETMWVMDFSLGFVPGFLVARLLDKLFVKLSRGKIAPTEKNARKADTVAMLVALGAFLVQIGILLAFCVGSGSTFGFALAIAYLFDSVLSFVAFVTIAVVYAVKGGAPSSEK
ncbi:MAG TPA: hypothetical protein DDY77_00895 [Clostridiales bacterium]|nr:hypothetical protein [Clostridiales bacterium]